MVKTRVAVAAGVVWLFLFASASAQPGYELLHVFAPAPGTPDGFAPAGPLAEGADGWIYGLTQRYGEDPHSSVTDAGALFRFDPADPAGTYEVVFSLREYARGDPAFIGTAVLDGGLVAAGDGNLYFATSGDCNQSGIFKVVPSGPVTLLLRPRGPDRRAGRGAVHGGDADRSARPHRRRRAGGAGRDAERGGHETVTLSFSL